MLTLAPVFVLPQSLSRRQVLRAGGAGLFGLSLSKLLRAESAAPPQNPRAKSVIFLFLFGGPSQLETFDMKPDAPADIRGPFQPIASRTPSLRICEHLPRLAQLSHKYLVLRSMSHSYNDHSGAGHYLQTGHRWHIPIGGGFNPTPRDWPSMGSMVEYLAQRAPAGLEQALPSYMVVPNSLGRLQEAGQYRRPGEHAGWLGQAYNPLATAVDKRNQNDNPYWRDCTDEELTFQIDGLPAGPELAIDRVNARRALVEQFDAERRRFDSDQTVATYDRFRRRAMALVASEKTRAGLDIRQEPAGLRERYGGWSRLGYGSSRYTTIAATATVGTRTSTARMFASRSCPRSTRPARHSWPTWTTGDC
jgi:hypothetical protein